MANTSTLSKEERKKAKRAARKKRSTDQATREAGLPTRLEEEQSEKAGARSVEARIRT